MSITRSKLKMETKFSKFLSILSNGVLWTIFYFFKFLGLAPLTVSKLKTSKTTIDFQNSQALTFSKSKFSRVHNIVLIVIISIASFIVFPQIKKASVIKDYGLGHSSRLIKVTMGILVMLIIWCSMIISHTKAIKILSQLTKADSGLKLFSDVYHLKSSKGSIILFFTLNVLMWIALCVLQSVVHDDFHLWICVILPNFIINWYLMQYAFILIMIEKRLKSINSALFMLSKSTMEPIYCSMNGRITNSKKSIRDNFQGIKQGYSVYTRICRDISDYYSVPTLFSIIFSLGAIVYSAFYVIQPLLSMHSNKSVISVVSWVFWTLIYLVPIFFLTCRVTRVLKETKMTSGIVYRVLAQSIVYYAAKEELHKFSLELLHRKVNFTANGVFPLDCRLIKEITSMVITNLIILFQFQLRTNKNES